MDYCVRHYSQKTPVSGQLVYVYTKSIIVGICQEANSVMAEMRRLVERPRGFVEEPIPALKQPHISHSKLNFPGAGPNSQGGLIWND